MWSCLAGDESLWTRRSYVWRSRLREDTCEIAQAMDDKVPNHSDESENGSRASCRLPWRN